jgi:hypothetical protein
MAEKTNALDRLDFFADSGPILIVGNYGSGKTEIAVNLAIQLRRRGHAVQIADLDIVNPYFRCREARNLMERHQIRVVVPPGHQSWADLPIVVPEIRGMLSPQAEGANLFDVGGDAVGARLLSSFADRLADRPYALWQVLNARRPFTDTPEGCERMMESIEQAARMRVTGFIANTHLVTDTSPQDILDGWRLARRVAERTRRELMLVTAMGPLAEDPALAAVDAPLLRLERHMLPPWLKTNEEQEGEDQTPAARPVPIGRPSGED